VCHTRYLACLSLDYTCFTEPECAADLTPGLQRNLDMQASTNLLLALFAFFPLLALSILGVPRYFGMRKEQQDARDPAESMATTIQSAASGADDAPTAGRRKSSVPAIELACTVLMLVPIAIWLRSSRQLLAWGHRSNGRAVGDRRWLFAAAGSGGDSELVLFGLALLFGLVVASVLWMAMAAVAFRARRFALAPPYTITDVLQFAYLGGPFKGKAAGWPVVLLTQHGLVFLSAWLSYAPSRRPTPCRRTRRVTPLGSGTG
jgi:hypothetical protein